MTVIITVDISDASRELDRLDRVPSAKGIKALEAVLNYGYEITNAGVHVETGSLKSSEKATSSESHKTWEGKLEWGGPSAGVNNPVDYAIYELARGGPHDFRETATIDLPPEWIEAVKEALKS